MSDELFAGRPPANFILHNERASRESSAETGYAAIALVNPKHPENVGGALRAASAFGASLVVVAGSRNEWLRHSTDTAKAYRRIPTLDVDDAREAVPFDCVPVAVEIADDACDLVGYEHPERAYYVFGPEDGSLGKRAFAWCRDVVRIPSRHCLNLAAAVNVVLYDRIAKQRR